MRAQLSGIEPFDGISDPTRIQESASLTNTNTNCTNPLTVATLVSLVAPFEGISWQLFRKFLKDFNLAATALGYSEDQCLRVFPLLLRGTAKLKYERISDFDRSNWQRMLTSLKELFVGEEETSRENLYNIAQQPGETVTAFAGRVDELVESAYPSYTKYQQNPAKAEHFFAGLSPSIRKVLCRKEFDRSDFMALLKAAEKEEAMRALDEKDI